MKTINFSKSFLAIGKTQESTEAQEFKKYIGLAGSYVLAVNPDKKKLEEIYGHEIQNDPEYILEDEERGKGFKVEFIVKTDPATNNGIEIISRATFRLFPTPNYNRDKSKVRIIDNYGNSTWMATEDAKAGKVALDKSGNPARIDTKYRIAFVGEADLLDFLRKYLFNKDSFRMVNGIWTKQADAEDVHIWFDDPKKLLSGNISEVQEALNMQPNNKIKLLYGVSSRDGKTYQNVCAAYDMMLRNNSGANALPSLERNLVSAKQSGMYSTVDYQICELKEWDVKPTNLDKPADNTGDMPFDASSADNGGMPWD